MLFIWLSYLANIYKLMPMHKEVKIIPLKPQKNKKTLNLSEAILATFLDL